MRKLGRMFAAAVALAVMAAVVIEIRASARWAEFTARTNQLRAKLEAERGEREPLVGPVRAGNAWDEYGPAMAELEARTKGITWDISGEVEAPGRDTSAYASVHACAPVLARLRQAVRCDRAFADANPSFTPLQRAVDMFILSVRERMLAGRVDTAIDELAVALQLASDAGQTPDLIGFVLGSDALVRVAREIVTVISDARVTFAHLERIDRLLEVLDRRYPSLARAVERDHVGGRQFLRDMAEGACSLYVPGTSEQPIEVRWFSHNGELAPWRVSLIAWRNGFSRRLLAAEAADWHERLVTVVQRSDTMSFKGADAAFRDLPAAPFLWASMPDAYRVHARSWRETRARLRLVQAATRVRRGLEPDVIDPVSHKPVGVRVEPEGIVLWLPWGKGNGTGKWEARRGDDLVLVVR